MAEFYAQVKGLTNSKAQEELEQIEISLPDPPACSSVQTSFPSPTSILDYLQKMQPDYQHVATYSWASSSMEQQKVVFKFVLKAGHGIDRAPSLSFYAYQHRKKWYRVKQSDAVLTHPYAWDNAKNSQRVVIARDEAEADCINGTGFSAVAVSSVGVWESEYVERFRGLDLVMLVDPDQSGRDYLEKAKADLSLIALSIRALFLESNQIPSLSAEDLQKLIASADDLLRPWKHPHCRLKSFERIPRFEVSSMLPRSLLRYIEEQAEEMQVPASALAAPALAGLSVLIGRKLAIQPKRSNPSFRVAAPLWCMIVADSGQKKSQILRNALAPLLEIDRRICEEARAIADKNAVQLKALLAREKRLEAMLANSKQARPKAEGDPILEELMAIQKAKADHATKCSRQYIVREVTGEKLLELMVRNPNGLMQIADEVPGWWRSLSTTTVDMRKLFLEGWDECQILVQRKSYGQDLAGTSIISVVGGAQSDWVQRIVNDIKNGKDNDGLVHRFSLLINHEPPIEPWQHIDRVRDPAVRDEYFGIFEAFHVITAADIFGDSTSGNAMVYTREAEEIFRQWLARKENQLRKEGYPRVLAAHISKHTRAFASLSLVFHLVLAIEAGIPVPPEIGIEAATFALRWCAYLTFHAERTFSDSRSHPLAARVMARKISDFEIQDRASLQKIAEHSWMHLDSETAVRSAASYLEKRNIVRIESSDGSEFLRINPSTLQDIGT